MDKTPDNIPFIEKTLKFALDESIISISEEKVAEVLNILLLREETKSVMSEVAETMVMQILSEQFIKIAIKIDFMKN